MLLSIDRTRQLASSRSAVVVFLAVAICLSAVRAEEAPTPTKPAIADAEAAAALADYDAAEAQALSEYAAALDLARTELVTKLETRFDGLTKAGKLDQAVAVRNLLAGYKGEGASDPKQVSGSYTIRGEGGRSTKMTLHDGGRAVQGRNEGKWEVDGSILTIYWTSGGALSTFDLSQRPIVGADANGPGPLTLDRAAATTDGKLVDADAKAAVTSFNTSEAKATADYARITKSAKAEATKKLKDRLIAISKSGALDEALTIRTEITKLESLPDSPGGARNVGKPKLFMQPFEVVGTWREGNGTPYVYLANGTFKYAGNQPGTWKVTEKGLILTWSNRSQVVTYDQKDGDRLQGRNDAGRFRSAKRGN